MDPPSSTVNTYHPPALFTASSDEDSPVDNEDVPLKQPPPPTTIKLTSSEPPPPRSSTTASTGLVEEPSSDDNEDVPLKKPPAQATATTIKLTNGSSSHDDGPSQHVINGNEDGPKDEAVGNGEDAENKGEVKVESDEEDSIQNKPLLLSKLPELPPSMKPTVRLERITNVAKFIERHTAMLMAQRKAKAEAYWKRMAAAKEAKAKGLEPPPKPPDEEDDIIDIEAEPSPDDWLTLLNKKQRDMKKRIEPVLPVGMGRFSPEPEEFSRAARRKKRKRNDSDSDPDFHQKGIPTGRKRGRKKKAKWDPDSDPDFDDFHKDSDDSRPASPVLPPPPPVVKSPPNKKVPDELLMSGARTATSADEFLGASLFGDLMGGPSLPPPPPPPVEQPTTLLQQQLMGQPLPPLPNVMQQQQQVILPRHNNSNFLPAPTPQNAQPPPPGMVNKTILVPTSEPNKFLQVTVAVPADQKTELVIKMVNDSPVTTPPTDAEKKLFQQLCAQHGVTRQMKVPLQRLQLSEATLAKIKEDTRRRKEAEAVSSQPQQQPEHNFMDIFQESLKASRELTGYKDPKNPRGLEAFLQEPVRSKMLRAKFEVSRAPSSHEIEKMNKTKARLVLKRAKMEEFEDIYYHLLRKGRDRDIMDFFLGKFYSPAYRSHLAVVPPAMMEPSAPPVPDEIEDEIDMLPDFDCYEVFHPKVFIREITAANKVNDLHKIVGVTFYRPRYSGPNMYRAPPVPTPMGAGAVRHLQPKPNNHFVIGNGMVPVTSAYNLQTSHLQPQPQRSLLRPNAIGGGWTGNRYMLSNNISAGGGRVVRPVRPIDPSHHRVVMPPRMVLPPGLQVTQTGHTRQFTYTGQAGLPRMQLPHFQQQAMPHRLPVPRLPLPPHLHRGGVASSPTRFEVIRQGAPVPPPRPFMPREVLTIDSDEEEHITSDLISDVRSNRQQQRTEPAGGGIFVTGGNSAVNNGDPVPMDNDEEDDDEGVDPLADPLADSPPPSASAAAASSAPKVPSNGVMCVICKVSVHPDYVDKHNEVMHKGQPQGVVKRPEQSRCAICVHCGESVPHDLYEAHLREEHGDLEDDDIGDW